MLWLSLCPLCKGAEINESLTSPRSHWLHQRLVEVSSGSEDYEGWALAHFHLFSWRITFPAF